MKTCLFCGWETNAHVCPKCHEYKGLIAPAEREFSPEQQRIIERIEREAEMETCHECEEPTDKPRRTPNGTTLCPNCFSHSERTPHD